MKRIYFFLVLLFTIATTTLNAQISKGKDFWFGFMQNYPGGTTDYRVYITSDVACSGVISSPLQGWSQNFTVTPGTSTLITVPLNIAENTSVNATTTKALHVKTTECVSVFAHSWQTATSDAEVIFPVNSVGSSYVVTSWYETTYNNGNPEFSIVATEGPTTVSVTLPISTQGYTANVPFTVNIDTGQVFQLQSVNGDLTGARITSTNGRNFAVFAGHTCADIQCTACDHLCEQMYPQNTWGTTYVTVPLQTRPYDIYRVVAGINGTTFTVNGGPPTTLNAGQFAQLQLSAVALIQSNFPVSVMQYSIGASCNTNGSTNGDPFMIMLSPVTQNINEVTFGCFPGSGLTYYLNIVANTSDLGTITLDGASIGGNFTPVPSSPTYATASLIVSQTDHTIISNQGIQAYVYAYGSYESFGYSAGVRVAIPSLSIYDTTRAYCPNDTVDVYLSVYDTSRIIYSEWDMGDGSPRVFNKFSFEHVYTNYGEYPVTFIYELLGACRRDTVVVDTIKILGPEPDLGGPYNFCVPQNLTITPTFKIPPDTIFWTVGSTNYFTTDPNYVLNIYADRDTVITMRMVSAICDGFDTAYIYVGHDTAGFVVNNACDGSPVTFTNTSQTVAGSAYTWRWDYGDGSTGIAPVAPHQYATPSTYNVKLVVTSPGGCSDSITHPVTISPQPHAWFRANPVCNTNVLTPTDSTIMNGGTPTYQWYFGDNTPVNTSPNPSHTYSQSGGYLVTLIASSPGCSDTASYMVNINIGADMAFTAPSVCWGNISTFTDASTNNSGSAILGYRWDFGDGNTATGTPITNNYTTAGTYTVKLVHDYGFNCYDSITKQVYVNAAPVAAFTVADACNTGTVAPVNNTTITPAGTGINYNWLYGDNTAAQTGNAPLHTYATSGTYIIQLIATSDSLCADTVTQPVNVIRGTNLAFTAPPVCEGSTTTFTNTTTNPYNTTIVGYRWDFGDGNTATTQNTTHPYNPAGTYNAELLLDYGNGCADSLTQQVVVNANPVAAFTVNDVCNDSVVTPVNTTTGATTYTWNFADGTGFVTGNAPPHTYHNSGQYTVQLVAAGAGGCADTLSQNIRVIIGTRINFGTGPVCEGSTTTFTDQTTNPYNTTINSYAWDFGDGGTGTAASTTHTYATPNTYTVELKLDYGFNCLDSITKQVAVNTNPIADFNSTIPCNGNAVQYTNTSTSADALAAYSWQFGDGGTATTQNASHTFGSFGTYNTKLTVYTINGCADSITKPVNVLEVGNAQLSVAPVCIGNPSMFYSTIDSVTYPVTSYQWNLVEATAGGSQTSHTYSTAGTKAITLIANFANGCADTATGNAVVNAQPVVSAAITNVSCFGVSDGAVNMTPVSGQPSFIYTWSTTPTNTPDNNNVPAGTYDFTVTDGNTCTTTGSYLVTQPTQLVVDTITDPISCFGYTDGGVTLSPTGASQPYTFVWSNGQTGQNLFGVGAGSYSVTVTDAQGCTVTASATLQNPALFEITNTQDVSVDLGQVITLTAQAQNGNAIGWLWSPDQNMTCATCQSTDVLTYNNMTYSLVVTSDLGCVDTAIVRVLVDPKRVVFVPNAFSPNGDGANDYFEVFGNKEAWKQFEVQVYNRIGEKVFESNDKDFKWDGTFKGVLQNPAVFVYVVKVIYLDNFTDMTYKGSLQLLR